jgi:hypothetical protein
MAQQNFYQVLTEAIADLSEHGFDRDERVKMWMARLERAAHDGLVPLYVLQRQLNATLTRVFGRIIRNLPKLHRGVSEYTLANIKPQLRAELDRRILASANLIKLNREASIARTLQRFSGWATSIPVGGSKVVDKRDEATAIRRGIAGLPFVERRVVIDQGHKLASAINEIVATDGGAIAAIWHSNWREVNYNYRKEHKKLDNEVFLVRDSLALQDGLVKKGSFRYTDDVEAPGQEIYCRCYWQFLYNLRDLPREALTRKGEERLREVRQQIVHAQA